MILSWLRNPWPWYVSGPLIALFVPLLVHQGHEARIACDDDVGRVESVPYHLSYESFPARPYPSPPGSITM
jgi:hypothetical protein